MVKTFFAFQDMGVEVDRPIEVFNKDADIGTRCYERLKGITLEDEWTHRIDKLIKNHNITFRKVEATEFVELIKNAKNVTARL